MAEQRHRTFEDLVAEGAAVPTEGWDFSWFAGRATEARPSWGYARAAGGRLARAGAALDIQTGGGEVLDFALNTADAADAADRAGTADTAEAAGMADAAEAAGTADTADPAATAATAGTASTADAADTTDTADTAAPAGVPAPAHPPTPHHRPRLLAATEGWPPNLSKASALLSARGVVVVASADGAPLPFADGTFDLVLSRHPVRADWSEIARVLSPGGTYFAQHVGPASVFELVERFLGPQPEAVRGNRHPDRERAAAEAAGLEIVELRAERLRVEFHDIAAVVHFLRKVVWMVPGFTVEAYEPQLRALHEQIEADGCFVAHSTRHLFDARKPKKRS
ncbi:methyltransferase domain-containing protein [Streptomyces sp. NPDC048277]|uniref:methyltransferase domain-containing protein n=1 Tax=Streptomyces sp. NPDC048277 TaxID=3155027 RepID=UPI0033E6136F